MAFTSGTATDYIDLADKFRAWITGTAGWTQLAWTPGNVTTGGMQLSLRGPGAAADKRVFVNIRSVFDDVNSYYSWDIRGAIAYDGSRIFGTQDGESSPTYLYLWKSAITYWFYANDRRFVIVAKVNTNYMSAHAGFILPWATPEQYPFPLYVAASGGRQYAYNAIRSSNRMFCDPGGKVNDSNTDDYCGGKIRTQSGVWYRVANHNDINANDAPWGSSVTSEATPNPVPFVWPYSNRGSGGQSSAGSLVYWAAGAASSSGMAEEYGAVNKLVPTAQNERMLLPVYVLNGANPAGFGAIDGVYFPMGAGLTPEQTASIGARNFRFFSNVHRTSGNDFFGIEEN